MNSCGRCSLYVRSNCSNVFCCNRRFAAGGLAVSCFSVRCIRSCRPFCSGCPGSIRSCRMPKRNHHIDSRVSPPGARLANGAPLSDRIPPGNPCLRNIAVITPRTCGPSVLSTARHTNNHRLKASLAVNGSQRVPSPHRNHPLKSTHQSSLGAPASVSGPWYGGVSRRRFRGWISPVRRSNSPMLLAAGQIVAGSCRCSQRRSFRGPQCGYLSRAARIAAAVAPPIACGL